MTGKVDHTSFDLMRDTLAHRGPDGADSHFMSDDRIALGHRRLSFIDLSDAGKQPMSNEDESIWIVLNGEIYNYLELREELKGYGHRFKSQTDTEVILHGYEQWGIEVLNKLKGMFAFGLVDLSKGKTFLVRDRFGIKPLYYAHSTDGLIFASELKAILADQSVPRKIDFSSFSDYFIYRYIPSPKTIWEGISKLPPAYYLEYDNSSNTIQKKEYWTIPFGHESISEGELIEEFKTKFENAIRLHSRSDVPIGSFLSGGYDSSAIAYYLTKYGLRPDTFSIGFDGWAGSEDQYASIVAEHLNLPNTSTVADASSLSLLDMMPRVYDEPIADISIIPTWMVSNLASKLVKAVMSGEGADELLGGYTWHKNIPKENDRSVHQRIFSFFTKRAEPKVSYYSEAMSMGRFDYDELNKMFAPQYQQYIPTDTDWFYRQNFDASLSPLQSIQKMDIKCFMGELVLTKIDRASMANSLEVRVPFLDHDLYSLVLSKREDIYYKPNVTKFLLYENIKQHLPDTILNRSKQGFVGPDSYYMNLDFYKAILDGSKLIRDGIIKKEYYQQQLAEKQYWRLWKLAVMEKWYQYWV